MPEVPIVEHESLSPTEFEERYLATHRPVILRGGAAHWPAVKKWTPSYLKAAESGSSFPVKSKSDYSDSGSKRLDEASEVRGMTEVVDMMERDDAPDMSYVRQADIKRLRLLGDIGELTYAKQRIRREHGKLGMGPRGTVAQLHWDPAHNLFVQVRGEKKWVLIAPAESHLTYPNRFGLSAIAQHSAFKDMYPALAAKLEALAVAGQRIEQALPELSQAEQMALYEWLAEYNNCEVDLENPDPIRTPLFASTTRYYGTLQSGDILFIPYAWRHFVRSLSPSISINWFFSPRGALPADVGIERTILEHVAGPTHG